MLSGHRGGTDRRRSAKKDVAVGGLVLRIAVCAAVGFMAIVVLAPGVGLAARGVAVKLRATRHVQAGGLARFTGTVSRASGRVIVERKSRRRWSTIARGSLGHHGRFALTWIATLQPGTVRVRAVAIHGGRIAGVSAVGRVAVRARKGPAIVVSRHTQVLDASTVTAAPMPGTAGTLTYSGGNDVHLGAIVAIGRGPATPDGFLGQVTSVARHGGETVAVTKPATLMQAVPTGSFNESLEQKGAAADRAASRALAHAAASELTCEGSVGAIISPSMSFGTSLDLRGSWKLFGGLQSASLTAGAHATASVTATIEGKGSCSLSPHTIVRFHGPGATFFVGPVPVVLTSDLSVDVDASASADAKATTGISGGFSAGIGVGWKKHSGFYPIQTFNPTLRYTPPTLSASAHVEANLTPKINVLLYGVAGPQLALKAGLSFNADTTKDPWWVLSAPVDLSASLEVPALSLSSPDLDLYKHTFTLANAGGPFGGPHPTGPVTFFDGSAGTGSPPSTLGPYVMQPFPSDETDEGTLESQLDGPTGPITFDQPLDHEFVGSGWKTWSNGYASDAYADDNQLSDGSYAVTITLPPNTGAFYVYAEPNEFEDFDMSATAADGTTSGDTTVFGDSGAQYFGFYASCGHTLSSVTVRDTGGDTAMAIGEFGIAPACSSSSAADTARSASPPTSTPGSPPDPLRGDIRRAPSAHRPWNARRNARRGLL